MTVFVVVGLLLLGMMPLAVAQTGRPTETDYQRERQIFTLETELSKLRRLHNQGKDKIRHMQREIQQYQTVFRGLRLICSTLCDCDGQYKPRPSIEAPVSSIRPTVSGINAHAVRTVVTPLGARVVLQLSVSFSTTETHQVIWAYNVMGHMIPIQDGDPYSSWRTEKENGRFTTQLYVDTDHLPRMELLYLKILSEFSELTILFNKNYLLRNDKINLDPVKLWNEQASPEVLMLKPTQNATIITNIDTNVQNLQTFVNFIGLDLSYQPSKLLDIHIGDERIQSVLVNTTKGFKWRISLDASLVSFGGLISLRTVERFENLPVLQVHVGKSMYIIPDKPNVIKKPFQPNSIGLLNLYKNSRQIVDAMKPIVALWCYAFGNPSPRTRIVKYSVDGKRTVQEGHVYSVGKYDAAHVVILRNISQDDAGQYVCEARSGNAFAIEPIILNVT